MNRQRKSPSPFQGVRTLLTVAVLAPSLIGCTVLQDLLKSNGTSRSEPGTTGSSQTSTSKTVTLESKLKLPRFAMQTGQTWTNVPASSLRGTLIFRNPKKDLLTASDFDVSSGSGRTTVGDDAAFVSATLSADAVIAEAQTAVSRSSGPSPTGAGVGPRNGNLTLSLRPTLTSVSLSAPSIAAKPGTVMRLEYLTFGPVYRVLMDESILRKASVVGEGNNYALIKAVGDGEVSVEVLANAPLGATIQVRLELQNGPVDGQTHPVNAVAVTTGFRVVAP
jgi:hypothetical protein